MTDSAATTFPADADTATAFAYVWQQLSTNLSTALPLVAADPTNVDALHNLRVALRKSRALLSLCPAKLSGRRRFERIFHQLALATGPLRDLDVLLQKIADTPDLDRTVPTSLEITLVARRADAQTEFVEKLRHLDIDALLQGWQEWLSDFPQRDELRARWRIPATVSIDVVVRDQSLALLRRGSKIDQYSPASELHKLRIRAKRLRYLLQGFLPLFDQEHYRPLIQALTDLQNLLGKHQDAVAIKHQLKDVSAELTRGGLLTPESEALLEHWRDRARQRRRRTRKDFPPILQAFADAANRI